MKKLCKCGCGKQINKGMYIWGHNRRKKPHPFSKPIYCKCGCGTRLDKWNPTLNKPVEYVQGHNPTRKMLGKKHTQEWKDNLSKKMKGKKLSKECIEKMKIERKGSGNPMYGKIPWNKGKKGVMPIPWNKGKEFWQIKGEKHPMWNGGITPLYMQIRHHKKYKDWAHLVKKRDNFTCQFCDVVGNKLCTDHIKPFAVIIRENEITSLEQALRCKELFNTDNGRTLCLGCHKQTDTYAKAFYYKYRYKERRVV